MRPRYVVNGLDGVERKLAGHELMICDGAAPIAIAGVLGGLTL
jgi:phenylalanyl-tRNA synthetase beta chain